MLEGGPYQSLDYGSEPRLGTLEPFMHAHHHFHKNHTRLFLKCLHQATNRYMYTQNERTFAPTYTTNVYIYISKKNINIYRHTHTQLTLITNSGMLTFPDTNPDTHTHTHIHEYAYTIY